jgi:ribose/xylose/arabinose/galactoside ABC-type transport system permease subunit
MNRVANTEAEILTTPTSTLDARRRLVLAVSRVWAWVFLVALILFFTISVSVSSGGVINFLSLRNTQSILVTITPVVLMGLGQTFVIISGGIDLSVGWVMGLASVVSAEVTVGLWNGGWSEPGAIAAGFAAGIAIAIVFGVINGTIIAKLGVPSFIVTLGMSFVARGVALIISGGNVVGGLPDGMRNLGNEALIYVVPGEGGSVSLLNKPDVSGDDLRHLERVFHWPVVIAAIAVGVCIFLLARTQFGRHTYAIGGSKVASLRAGVPVSRMTILIYALSAATAGLAGCLHTARFAGGSGIAGEPLLLSSIAAVIIGGVSMFGGRGNVVGTVIGALIIAILVTGLILLGVDPYWQFIIIGVVVILAVLIDQARDVVAGRAEAS